MKPNMVCLLNKAKRKDKTRMHMPGAKGRHLGFLKGIFKYDFTEIDGLDNLYAPEGMIKTSQKELAADIDADSVMYLVNGSSTGVLAMLSLFSGKRVLMARDFHMSAANAISLFKIDPVFVYPKNEKISTVINAERVKAALQTNSGISAIYLTYPNYFGFCANLKEIVSVAHEKHIPVIVDAAHSACFGYSNALPMSPAQAGADAWVVSTHKTLPAMNQSAYLAIGAYSLVSADRLKASINQIQTTSPSYPILASIDFAKDYMRKKGAKQIEPLVHMIHEASRKIDGMAGFKVLHECEYHVPKDPMKWVVDYYESGLSLLTLKAVLKKHGVFPEMMNEQYVLFLVSPTNTKRDIKKVLSAFKKITPNKNKKSIERVEKTPRMDDKIPLSKIRILVDLNEATGMIAAHPVAVYPPGVPIILEGNVLNSDVVDYLKGVKQNGQSVVGMKGNRLWVFGK